MLAVMEESRNKKHVEGGDREILYSKAIKAGKRIYYLDVKRNLKDDLFVAVTESKKIQSRMVCKSHLRSIRFSFIRRTLRSSWRECKM